MTDPPAGAPARRRRVLLMAYYYPPVPSVGSVRMGALAKYLPACGWDVSVVTPVRPGRRPAHASVVETPDVDPVVSLKRLLGLRPELGLKDQIRAAGSGGRSRLPARLVESLKGFLLLPDAQRGWVRVAARAGRDLAARLRVDAVISSSPPVSAHLAARRLRAALGAPWIADLRDLWSDDHNSTAPRWRRRLDRFLERRTFASADALVTVSAPLAARLREVHPELPTWTILNGFDPEFVDLGHRPGSETFTICHTGTFYQGRRDPSLLFDALRALLDSGRLDRARVRVRLLCRQEPWLGEAVAHRGLESVVRLEPWVSWEAALRAQQDSQILLLLHWGGAEETGVYTGKVFEYLAARRPILMVGGGEGVLADLLRETGSGVHVTDQPALEGRLLEWWGEFERTGSVAYRGDPSCLERFTHPRMAAEFAAVLDDLAQRPSHSRT